MQVRKPSTVVDRYTESRGLCYKTYYGRNLRSYDRSYGEIITVKISPFLACFSVVLKRNSITTEKWQFSVATVIWPYYGHLTVVTENAMFYNTETYLTVIWPFITAVISFITQAPGCKFRSSNLCPGANTINKLRKKYLLFT